MAAHHWRPQDSADLCNEIHDDKACYDACPKASIQDDRRAVRGLLDERQDCSCLFRQQFVPPGQFTVLTEVPEIGAKIQLIVSH